MQRRQFIQYGSVLGTMGLLGACTTTGSSASAGKVIVIGGGYGGATAAKYIRMWSDYTIQVILIEPNASFISCPISNLVLSGVKKVSEITSAYDGLTKNHGVQIVHDRVKSIDATKRSVTLASGTTLTWDRLVVSPGIDFMWEKLPGMQKPVAQDKIMHAWKAGEQTVKLRSQLESMPDGGVFAMAIPLAPYRCPPGPYERVCQVAYYFKNNKPNSKILVLDANENVTSKGPLFKKAWADLYSGMIEYLPRHNLVDVDAKAMTLKFEFNDDVKASVLNVIPPMRAGKIAVQSGLATANNRWCEVDFLTFESKVMPNVHILGDAIQTAPLMPKSGHMANQHGKTCAAAVVALLTGKAVNPTPIYNNTCYSFISANEAVHVASVHQYDADKKTMLTVHGSGGVSKVASETEGSYAFAWANNIWADTLN